MKKFLLLLMIPFLLSQCKEREDTETKELKQQQYEARSKTVGLVQVATSEQMPAELLKLLKQHENDPLPLEGLPIEESERICDIDGAVLGWIAVLNVSIEQMSPEQYSRYVKKLEHDLELVRTKDVVQMLQRILKIIKKYENGPFPLKPIPTKELEETYYKSYLDWSVRTFFNHIAWKVGTSREKFSEILKNTEETVNKRAYNAH